MKKKDHKNSKHSKNSKNHKNSQKLFVKIENLLKNWKSRKLTKSEKVNSDQKLKILSSKIKFTFLNFWT